MIKIRHAFLSTVKDKTVGINDTSSYCRVVSNIGCPIKHSNYPKNVLIRELRKKTREIQKITLEFNFK